MKFNKVNKFTSSVLVLGMVLQSGLYLPLARAEGSAHIVVTETVTQTEQVQATQPIYHIALTPWESNELGIENLQTEMVAHKRASHAANVVNNTLGTVMFLTITGAAVYLGATVAGKYVPNYNLASKGKLVGESAARAAAGNGAFSALERLIFKLSYYLPTALVGNLPSEVVAEAVANPAVQAGTLVGIGTLANLVATPFYFLKSWTVDKLMYPLKKADKERLESAFAIVQAHADQSCAQVNARRAKSTDASMIQSLHFSDEDFALGRVYLDGQPISKAEASRLDAYGNGAYYVFSAPVQCKTGYFTSEPLDALL